MSWNWQLQKWPQFRCNPDSVREMEKQFLLGVGGARAVLKTIDTEERRKFTTEILSVEGVNSSKIEGEFLERESLQSSIRRHFGINTHEKKVGRKEQGMAELLCNVYENSDHLLRHEDLYHWHSLLFSGENRLEDLGCYRSHDEPMQIVSSRYGSTRVYFEAPPSASVPYEMEQFINRFNQDHSEGSILVKAALAHLHFESIHPFEDGNGRIGRALVEKVLSQGVGQPVLLALSLEIEKRKKSYYEELGKCNRSLEAGDWVLFFSELILKAQEESMRLLSFLIAKSRMMSELSGQLNPRQEKVLIRMFAEGVDGFAGGLSAENYLSITKTTRATATRDLADLVKKEALVKKGQLRYTRYFINLN